MTRILVTGADGFVGRHLARLLADEGAEVVRICGASIEPDAQVVDIRDLQAVHDVVERARPNAIVHLAGISSVALSHEDPATTFSVNVQGTLNLCLAVKSVAPTARLLLIGSGEVYGATAWGVRATEQTALEPSSPYATSKLASEAIGLQFARSYAMNVVCARPYNHLGAGQAPTFAIPSFSRQLVAARRAGGRQTILVGNLDPVRDFSHVRDVVNAYRLLLERGESGQVYNVCSGLARSVRSVLDELIELAGADVDVRVDPARSRPVDIPYMAGDATKLLRLGWNPRWTLRDALTDALAEAAGVTSDTRPRTV